VDQVLIVVGRGVSDNSFTNSEGTILEASLVASDQDGFGVAYEALPDLSEGLYDIDTRQCARGGTSDDAPGVKLSDGEAKLRELVHLPRNWPLARLTIPLGGGFASKLKGSLRVNAFRSWLPTATRMHTMER